MKKICNFIKRCLRFFINRVNKLIQVALWLLLLPFPVNKNKVVVCSFLGRGYCDNPKYIVNSIIKKNSNIRIIWLLKNKNEKYTLPDCVKVCKYNSINSAFHLATAKVWIDNTRKSFLYKKKNQLYIQTWHGGGMMKKVEQDVEKTLSTRYIKQAKKDSKYIDFMISESSFLTYIYSNSFWYNGYVLEVGYPRYDILFEQEKFKELKSKISKILDFGENKSIVLYAPTFRKDYLLSSYNLQFNDIKKTLDLKFDKDFIILMRLHPNLLSDYKNLKLDSDDIINASAYPDLQELLLISDITISDYSSVLYDFSLTGKPAFCFATDLDDYKQDRNFYLDISEYPYPLATSNSILIENIMKFDENKYKNDIQAFYKRTGAIFNCNASDVCADLVIDYVSGKSKSDLIRDYNAKKVG